jgi:hypothetical protein
MTQVACIKVCRPLISPYFSGMWCRSVHLLTVLLFICLPRAAAQQDSLSIKIDSSKIPEHREIYAKPRAFSFITNMPKDVWGVTKGPFNKNGWKGLLAVAASSAILIHFDQQLLDGAMSLGRDIHWNPQNDYKVVLSIKKSGGDIKLFKVPQNINSAFYNLGEGWIGVAIGGGFWLQGKISHNNRSLQTASDLMEGFLSTAVLTQVVKRITGRESPFERTVPGGRWRPLPSFKEFANNTSSYDAFPSGHLATMMTTVTILADNYPDSKWIKPIGYTLMGLTSFAMMNTEVHWAGDYPLALALGYLNGRIITARHKKPVHHLPDL